MSTEFNDLYYKNKYLKYKKKYNSLKNNIEELTGGKPKITGKYLNVITDVDAVKYSIIN